MWIYEQVTGVMHYADGKLLATGYSGWGFDKDKPESQAIPDKGPIPQGYYSIQPPVDTATHGPFVLWLTPDARNEMFGRSAFGIHGDSLVSPGNASWGCIIMPRYAREAIWQSGDHRLQVIANL